LIGLPGDRPLDFAALMSSISSVESPGANAYAAANAVLEMIESSDNCEEILI
jgi:hypothetical protein